MKTQFKKNWKNHHLTLKSLSNNAGIYLILITTLVVLLVNTGSLYSIDTFRRLQVTHWLWTNAPQVRVDDTDYQPVIGRNQEKYAMWGIGQSLVMLPSDIIAHKLIGNLQVTSEKSEKIIAAIVNYLTFPIINILSIVISLKFLEHLGFTTRQAIYGSLGLLFGTTFLIYSQVHQENSLMFLMTLSGYLLNVLWLKTDRGLFLFLGACALGFSLLIRLTNLMNIFAVSLLIGLMIIIQAKAKNWDLNLLKRRFIKYLLICVPVYLFFLGLDRVYHWIRFGTLTGTYLSVWGQQMKVAKPSLPDSFPFNTPFSVGFLGHFFSLEKSIFLFDPLLIITLVIAFKFWHRLSHLIKALLLSLSFLLFTQILIYSYWMGWKGGGAWGARFLSVPVQLLSLLAIPLLIQVYPLIKSTWEKSFYKIIVIFSILVQLSSVVFDYNLEINQGATFIIGQRFINLVALITGNFEHWGLIPTNLSLSTIQKYTTPAFMPWRTLGEIPLQLSYFFQFAWFVGFAFLLFLLTIFLKKIAKG